jgi:hypothetical protein
MEKRPTNTASPIQDTPILTGFAPKRMREGDIE